MLKNSPNCLGGLIVRFAIPKDLEGREFRIRVYYFHAQPKHSRHLNEDGFFEDTVHCQLSLH